MVGNMQLSVFDKITLPKNKQEKTKLAIYSSSPYQATRVCCSNLKSLIKTVTTNGYSPSIFNGTRNQSNFLYTDFLILDIDTDLTIDDAFVRVELNDLLTICLTTTSHKSDHHKFRLIFPITNRICNKRDFIYNMERLRKIFPEADKQCVTDCARFFFPSNLTDDGFVYEGKLFVSENAPELPEKHFNSKRMVLVGSDIKDSILRIYGVDRKTVPECVSHFIKNASTGLPGEWNSSINAVSFTLALQGFTYQDVYDIIESFAPYPLDDRDEYTIDRSYNQGLESKDINVSKQVNTRW